MAAPWQGRLGFLKDGERENERESESESERQKRWEVYRRVKRSVATEPIKKLLIRQIVTALALAAAANTKNEFYISTFSIICIIYDVLGNVVKLKPLKMLTCVCNVCVIQTSA